MRLAGQLLIAPLVALGFCVVMGGVTYWSLSSQRSVMKDGVSRSMAGYRLLESSAQSIARANVATARAMALIGSLSAREIGQLRASVARGLAEAEDSARRAAAVDADDRELAQLVESFTAGLKKFAKRVDDAIDMASVDPNTGVAALQSAERDFDAVAAVLAKAEKRQQDEVIASMDGAIGLAGTTLNVIAIGTVLAAIGSIAIALRMARRISADVHACSEAARTVASGALTVDVGNGRTDEIGDLSRALGDMAAQLRAVVARVREGVDSVRTASQEIAQGNSDLSTRTEQQASNLQQTAASMEQMTGSVQQNSEAARQVNQLASEASAVAARGGQAVAHVIATMDAITERSQKIANIIGVIDNIAFQTNLLALNAAVEAARAGEQGRGFAVVAGEVRALAQRSAQAAHEIKDLINDNVEKVEKGAELVEQAGITIAEIVTQVRRVSELIGGITHATLEQSSGIAQVNQAIAQLDRMTQQNAALVEQSSAAAHSMSEQAGRLAEAVAMFRLEAGVPATA